MKKEHLMMTFLIFLAYNLFSQNVSNHNISDDLKSKNSLSFNGIATNLQAESTDVISFKIEKSNTSKIFIKGSFGNMRLFGSFEGELKNGYYNKNNNSYILTFKGIFYVGGRDGSGFPDNTKGDFTFSIVLKESVGYAIYIIGPLSNNVNFEQFGFINYALNHKIDKNVLDYFFNN